MNCKCRPVKGSPVWEAADRWHAAAPHDLNGIQEPVVVQGDGNVANMLWDGSRVRLLALL